MEAVARGGHDCISCAHPSNVDAAVAASWRISGRHTEPPLGRHEKPTMYFASMDMQTAFHVAGPKHLETPGRARHRCETHSRSFKRIGKLKGQTNFEHVERKFNLTSCSRYGSDRALAQTDKAYLMNV